MSSLLDRARRALAPHYEVEGELGAGGMGDVFVARDRGLDRRVAVKVLRPELATAVAAERFQREARILARLHHPNVVPVHQVGEADGLLYYVMDLVQGETLEARLRRGALDAAAVAGLGSDLLSALDAAHAAGVVHRDVKPSNIFLVEGRALLADFGISRLAEGEGPALTTPGGRPGTPGYMPPEQAAGGEVTPRTDLYAVGMLLYEAITGRRWSILEDPESAAWIGIGRRPARALRRALAWDPAARWPTAAAFREAWRRAHARPLGRLLLGVAVAAFAIGVGVRSVVSGRPEEAAPAPGVPPTDLAIVPFEARPSDTDFARGVAWLVYNNLAGRPWLTLTPTGTAYCAPDTTGVRSAALAEAERPFASRWRATGSLAPLPGSPDSVVVDLVVSGPAGERILREVRGRWDDQSVLGTEVALTILEAIRTDMAHPYRGLAGLRDRTALPLREFLLGEQALRCDDRLGAEAHFAEAVRLDPSFALAAWRLAIARRWLQKPPEVDLTAIHRRYATDLSPLDSLLLGAFVEPRLEARLARYDSIVRRYPRDGFARLLYGDELFHRGPLAGIPIERAIVELDSARILDPLLALASDHLLSLQIRLGREEAARATLAHLLAVTGEPRGAGSFVPYVPILLGHAFLERFRPDSAAAVIDSLFGPPVGGPLPILLFSARWGLSLAIPRTELELGRRLAAADGAGAEERATGLVAEGLALVHLGRPAAALLRFDSAAAVHPTAEFRVQAAEWRVLPSRLGAYPPDAAELERGRRELLEAHRDPRSPPDVRARAAFALGVDALAEGRRAEARAWSDSVATRAAAAGARPVDPLRRLLEARLARRAGRVAGGFDTALAATGALVGADSAGRTRRPFGRAAMYLWLAAWADSAGRSDDAIRHLLWHTGNDLAGLAIGPAQAGEVDWALESYARLQAGRVAARLGDAARACAAVAGLAALWREAEGRLTGLREEAAALETEACGA